MSLLLTGAGGSSLVDPSSLFAAGEQGVWFDPTDMATLFQTSNGPGALSPVTALEQPVGFMLDKRLPMSANLFTNGDFSGGVTGWTTIEAGWSISGGVATHTGVTETGIFQSNTVVGKVYLLSVTATGTGTLLLYAGGYQGELVPASGTLSAVIRTGAGTFAGIKAVNDVVIDNISIRELPGNHALQATAAARPVLSTDANGKVGLRFDGIDDCLVTSAIDFSASDKATFWAGVRKESDAVGPSAIAEVGTGTGAGTFGVFGDTTARYYARLSGSTAESSYHLASYAAPIANVISVAFDLAGAAIVDEIKPRINGAIPTLTEAFTGPAGAGNLANAVLYLGRRANTTLPFNGFLHNLIIRGGASTAAQIQSIERHLAAKSAVSFP